MRNHGLSDYITSGLNATTLGNLYAAVKTVIDSHSDEVVSSMDAYTTIGDVAGKIIVKISLTGTMGTDPWKQLNQADVLINTFSVSSTVNASKQLWYSRLNFGDVTGIENQRFTSLDSSWPMAFIYFEQANPCDGSSTISSSVTENTTSQINAFYNNYNPADHKIFGMTYLGGCGNSHNGAFSTSVTTVSPTDVTTSLIATWNTATGDNNNNIFVTANKPYGWVLFNMVGSGEDRKSVV